MTSRIYINIEADTAEEARRELAGLLGSTALSSPTVLQAVTDPENQPHQFKSAADAVAEGDTSGLIDSPAPKRERGQPSPGKARRTKAEIAEDDAAAAAEGKTLAEAAAERADDKPLISTDPENRVGPEDTPEDAAQDAADEAAETAAASTGALTLDDVRNALGEYANKYGMAAAQEDGPKVLKLVCGDGVAKISQVPEDPAVIAKVVAGVKEMSTKNPFQREAVPA